MKPRSTAVTPPLCCPGKGGFGLRVVKRQDVSDLVQLERVRFSGRMHVCQACHRAQFDAGGVEDAHALIVPLIIDGRIPISGGVMKYVRARLDLSQSLICGITGMSRAAIQRWERSNAPLSVRDSALLRAMLAIHFAESARSNPTKLRRLELASRAFDRIVTGSPADTVIIGRGLEYEVPHD